MKVGGEGGMGRGGGMQSERGRRRSGRGVKVGGGGGMGSGGGRRRSGEIKRGKKEGERESRRGGGRR